MDCPLPHSQYERITLAHGGGGRVMHRLIADVFRRAFDSPELEEGLDGARLSLSGPIAMTTDAFTVKPLFFPGGDIGSLAVHGTTNDLAVTGARPRFLSASFVLEEGLAMADLERIVQSMSAAARASGVRVVAGDTKVVERGKGDGVFITTTGIGDLVAELSPRRVQPGDAVLVSGPVGDHGTAVMLARERLELPEGLLSDAADITPAVSALLKSGAPVRCLRDATRGGMATVVCEIAQQAQVGVRLSEEIPVRPQVRDACELLGLDPLYVACEGRFVAFVSAEHAGLALEALRSTAVGRGATFAGTVARHPAGVVSQRNAFGGERVIDLLSGEQLPRIC